MGLGFIACDDYDEPNPKPQTNPQESILKTDDVTVASALSTDTYDLVALNDAETPILVATITTSELPEGYEFVPKVEISKNGFAKATVVASTIEKATAAVAAEGDAETKPAGDTWNVYVTADALQGAYVSGISKGPKAKQIEARVQLMTKIANMTSYVGGIDHYYGGYALTVLPFPSDFVIEDAYYLVGTACDWQVAQAIKFDHSEEDVYDDPVFTLAVDVTAQQASDGWWWKIIPASTYETGNWVDAANASFGPETNGDDSLEGMLFGRTATEDSQAGCLLTEGQQLLTINMEELTYEFSPAVFYLYTPGDSNGWSQPASQRLYTSDFANYQGFANLAASGFKLTNAPDWDHINYGNGGDEGVLSTDGGAGNLVVPANGLYWLTVNTASLTWTYDAVSTFGIIGDATPNGWDASTALTPSEDNLTWTGTVALKAGEFKFRANDAWAISLGGDTNDLVFDGKNMKSPGEGTYDVTLRLDQIPYSCTLVKK